MQLRIWVSSVMLSAIAVIFSASVSRAQLATETTPLHTAYNGPLLQLVLCPQAEYESGSQADCSLYLKNSSTKSFSGKVEVTVWQSSTKLLTLTSDPILDLAPGKSLTLEEKFTVPSPSSPRGFLLIAHALTTNGAVLDSLSGYLEIASSYLTFPRPATIGNPVTTTDAHAQLLSFLAYGINLPVYYDIYYKAHVPAPPANASSWTNLEGMLVQRSTVNDFVSGSHDLKMGIFMLQDWFAANDDWSTDGSGMSADWAIFRFPCKTAAHPAPCTIWDGTDTSAEQWAQGSNWKAYGWKTNNLPVFDPTNPAYVKYFISHVQDIYSTLGLDGLWIDTLGDLGSHVYRADGSQVNGGRGLGPSLVDFTNAVIDGTGHPAYINNVDGWASNDIASRSKEPFIYSEIWSGTQPNGPNGTPLYTDINGRMHQYRTQTMRPVVFPAYLNDAKRASKACAGVGITTPCYTNEPSAHYLTSQILASGAYHMVFEENDTMDAGPYFVQEQLHMTPSLIAAELDLQHFGIGYEDILRDHMVDSQQMCNIVSTKGGPIGDYAGVAGHVYTLPKSKPGVQVCHLLNHSSLTNTHWKDDHGTYPAATAFNNFGLKVYYTGTVSKVWFASPDVKHGEPQVFAAGTYATASDAQGTYVQLTVPSLTYWDMIVVETNPSK